MICNTVRSVFCLCVHFKDAFHNCTQYMHMNNSEGVFALLDCLLQITTYTINN